MAWIGVAPEPLKQKHLLPSSSSEKDTGVRHLLSAISKASSPEMKTCAAAFQEKLSVEVRILICKCSYIFIFLCVSMILFFPFMSLISIYLRNILICQDGVQNAVEILFKIMLIWKKRGQCSHTRSQKMHGCGRLTCFKHWDQSNRCMIFSLSNFKWNCLIEIISLAEKNSCHMFLRISVVLHASLLCIFQHIKSTCYNGFGFSNAKHIRSNKALFFSQQSILFYQRGSFTHISTYKE